MNDPNNNDTTELSQVQSGLRSLAISTLDEVKTVLAHLRAVTTDQGDIEVLNDITSHLDECKALLNDWFGSDGPDTEAE